ncbi:MULTISPECIES: ABC transporter permease [Bacillales]|uniref:ABC transporter permease n=1 Tax=Bacillales TaxID=1385 RepID=UPI000BBD7824|nr:MULTISPECIES: ABC transporter permease [Paenibacillus]PCL92708.1 peptide ABC transporter [Paenibacillus lautus]QOT09065.1 ABC transporter permease [Paenibacillus sp. JNUCC-32]WFB58971.1 ABC transporter permease [Paenibacillus sp. BR1-192]
MLAYITKRLLSLIPVLAVVTIAIFLIIHITPGNPAAAILGMEASQEEIEQLNQDLGLDRPILEQYTSWVANVFKGDLGDSIFMNQPVSEAIAEHITPTLSLAILAQVIAILLAIPFGIIAAYKRGSIADYTLMGISLLGMALPSFLLGLFLMLFVGVKLQWLPVAGYEPLSSGLWEHMKYLILPGISLGTIQAALITRMTRSSMLEVLNLNFIKTARSKGLHEMKVLFKHAFRSAFLPILTVIGQTFGTLVTGAVVVEAIFNIPGLGQLILNSIARRDFVVIQGVVLVVTLMYVTINLIIDLLYGAVDPRVRLDRK